MKTKRICHKCGKEMNTWDCRLSSTFKTYDTCEECFCSIYGMDKNVFRQRMEDYLDIRPCKGII